MKGLLGHVKNYKFRSSAEMCDMWQRIYLKKPVVFLFTSNEQIENEIKKTVPITIASRR